MLISRVYICHRNPTLNFMVSMFLMDFVSDVKWIWILRTTFRTRKVKTVTFRYNSSRFFLDWSWEFKFSYIFRTHLRQETHLLSKWWAHCYRRHKPLISLGSLLKVLTYISSRVRTMALGPHSILYLEVSRRIFRFTFIITMVIDKLHIRDFSKKRSIEMYTFKNICWVSCSRSVDDKYCIARGQTDSKPSMTAFRLHCFFFQFPFNCNDYFL